MTKQEHTPGPWWVLLFVMIFALGCLGVIAGMKHHQTITPTAKQTIKPGEKYAELLNYVWMRESSLGKADTSFVGPAGERGEYQVTPIFVADVERVSGFIIDPYDNTSCRKGITLWFDYWLPRVDAVTVTDRYELYRRGPTGFRRWKPRP